MAKYSPGDGRKPVHLRIAASVALMAMAAFIALYKPSNGVVFVSTPASSGLRLRSSVYPSVVARRAETETAADVDDSIIVDGAYPPEAYKDYAYDETPPIAYWERRKLDRHKINMMIFDLQKKPKSFFPIDLRPGDTVRITYIGAQPSTEKASTKITGVPRHPKSVQEKTFDGVILRFKGDYASRTMKVRGMVGRGDSVLGYEVTIPIHSPSLISIKVLNRGYIGINKNAMWFRGMMGPRNKIPSDKARNALDTMYRNMIIEGRADEVPEAEYPKSDFDSYPLPDWKQGDDQWDEQAYDPEMVDTRSEYQRRIIDAWRKRPKRINRPEGEANRNGRRSKGVGRRSKEERAKKRNGG